MKLINMKQTADLLGINRATVTRWQQEGILPRPFRPHGAGSPAYYHREQIERLFDGWTENQSA